MAYDGSLIREELASALQGYARERGGSSPNVPNEILPVVLVDSNEKGPYPAYRAFNVGSSIGGVVGQYSYIGCVNNDPAGTRSVVVIDEIYYRTYVADDISICICTTAEFTPSGPAAADDCAESKDQQPSFRPKLGNVIVGQQNNVSLITGTAYPNQDVVQHVIRGPWTLGPQGILLFRSFSQNVACAVTFRGRYYPPV